MTVNNLFLDTDHLAWVRNINAKQSTKVMHAHKHYYEPVYFQLTRDVNLNLLLFLSY